MVETEIKKILYDNEIKTVIVNFNGSGDSGTIDISSYQTIDDEFQYGPDMGGIVIPEDKIPLSVKNSNICTENAWDSTAGRYTEQPRNLRKKPIKLDELVIFFVEEWLEEEHPGWEINEGSFGSVTFIIRLTNTGELDINKSGITYEHEYGEEEYDEEEEYA